MRCPDWRLLSSLQERDPEAWARGLEHFDRCESCRELALAAEPTLMFRRLPAPSVDDGDVAAMKQAVAVLRRSGVERTAAEGAARRLSERSALLKVAAVAALLIGAVALQGGIGDPYGSGDAVADAVTEEAVAGDPETFIVASLSRQRQDLSQQVEDLPLVEAVDPAYGSVVQVVDDEISLVLVLPPTDV